MLVLVRTIDKQNKQANSLGIQALLAFVTILGSERGKTGATMVSLLIDADIPAALPFYMVLWVNNTDRRAQDTLKESQSLCVTQVLTVKQTNENWQSLW